MAIGFGSDTDTLDRRDLQGNIGIGQNNNAAFTFQVQLSSTLPPKDMPPENEDVVELTSPRNDESDWSSSPAKNARYYPALPLTILLLLPFVAF